MYLLSKPYKFYSEPFPHIVIEEALPNDIASYMEKNFPMVGILKKDACQEEKDNWQHRGNYDSDPVFKDFAEIHQVIKKDEFVSKLDEIFNQPESNTVVNPLYFRNQIPSKNRTCLRDWHLDDLNKKYHGLLYLGSGDEGELEMKSPDNDNVKSYPYTHNRFIMWLNDERSIHRFFASNKFRKTISIAVEYQ